MEIVSGISWMIIIVCFCYLIMSNSGKITYKPKIKKKRFNFTYKKDYDGIKRCNRCGEEIHGSSNGEGGKDGKKWKYWHNECYNLKYCEDVGSSPDALAKYHQIYGMSPEDKIINCK